MTPPKARLVGPGDWISAEYEEHVSGDQEGELVTVHEIFSLLMINLGGNESEDSIWFHVVNAPDSLTIDPPAEGKSNQQTMVEGNPFYPCKQLQLAYDEELLHEVEFGVVVDWELRTCTNYTKTINFIDFGETGSITLFDTTEIDQFDFIRMDCCASVQVEGDENNNNFCKSVYQLGAPMVVYYSP